MTLDGTKASLILVNASVSALAALLGALSGKLWDAARERSSIRQALVVRYLSQLQTTTAMLTSRLGNLIDHVGAEVMSSDYLQFTTLYAFACPLALERIFMLDGVYPQIAKFDRKLFHILVEGALDKQLHGFNFHRYDRVALAECAMVRDNNGFRLATYFEFRDRYELAVERKDGWLAAASKFISQLKSEVDQSKFRDIQSHLKVITEEISHRTQITT